MICYRDRWFCSALCETKQCSRNFTDEVQAQAAEWWKGFKSERPCPVDFKNKAATCPDYRPPVATHGAKALDAIPEHDMVDP